MITITEASIEQVSLGWHCALGRQVMRARVLRPTGRTFGRAGHGRTMLEQAQLP